MQKNAYFCTIFLEPEAERVNAFFRIWAYLKHRLTAWNTTGEGIHSPSLFYLVRFVLRDRNAYYCFRQIEQRRALLLACPDEIEVVDYGSCGTPEGKKIRRRVNEIVARQLESPAVGQMLFRIANYLGREAKRPLNILELGTSLGITTAYLAAADSKNNITTLEGSEAVLKIAESGWSTLGLRNITPLLGRIEDTLYIYAREGIDLAYIDANHTFEATMRYADYLLPRMAERGILAIDDIHYSREMERAWKALKQDPRVTSTIDLYDVGLVFVDRHYMKRHYIIRL